MSDENVDPSSDTTNPSSPSPGAAAPTHGHHHNRPRINSNTSRTSRRSRKKSSAEDDSEAAAGITVDENGESSFHFRRNSIYAPLPGRDSIPGEDGLLGERDPRKSLPAMRRSCGIGGPLITTSFLQSKDGDRDSSASLEEVGGGGGRVPRKKIRLLGCIGVVIGCVLGSGIFAAPQVILEFTGSAGMTLVIWGSYGIIALVGALCYVELGCTIPVSGGEYAYLNECFGPLAAFLFQWAANFVIIPVVVAIMASVVAKNLINPYVDDPQCEGPYWASCCIAVMLIYLILYINYLSSELAEKIQGWLMVINLLTITLIIICGIVHICRFGVENKDSFSITLPTPPGGGDRNKFIVLQLVMALYHASFSYVGYTCVTYIMEDVENPLRTLPLAIMISLPFVIVLNIFVNFCYLASVSLKDLMKTETVANEMMRSMSKDPSKFPAYFVWIGPTLVAIAVTGGLLSSVFTCARIPFIGARNRHFPGIFKMTHFERMTPVVSLAFMGLIGGTYAMIPLKILIGILSYIESAVQCAVMYGLIYLRLKKPYLPRPFKLWLFVPIAYAFVLTFLFVTPILLLDGDSWKNTIPTLGGAIFVLFLGIPVYFIFVHRGIEWKPFQKGHGRLKVLLQKMWLVIPEEDFLILDEDDDFEEEEIEGVDLTNSQEPIVLYQRPMNETQST